MRECWEKGRIKVVMGNFLGKREFGFKYGGED
jgi:hypothetical protein